MTEPSEANPASALLTGDQISSMPETHISHPWNPNSEVFLKRLARATGLTRIAITLARVPPGKESFIYHSHERDEEFVYIISGRGRAEIGEEVFEVGSGDFMGFPAPGGPAHHLLNPYDEELVYLMGGESSGFDIGHFPREGKHIMFRSMTIHAYDDSALTPMTFDQFLAERGDRD